MGLILDKNREADQFEVGGGCDESLLSDCYTHRNAMRHF